MDTHMATAYTTLAKTATNLPNSTYKCQCCCLCYCSYSLSPMQAKRRRKAPIICSTFFLHNAMLAQVLSVIMCPSICLSVTRRYCVKTAKRKIAQTTLRDIPGTLMFWRQQLLVGDSPYPWNLRSKWPTPPFEHNDFHQYLLIMPQPWKLVKDGQLALIGSWPHAFQRAIDEPCTLLKVPQRVVQNAILLFLPVKFNFCRKKSAAKLLCVKASGGKVVATSFLYLTFHRRIAGDLFI